MNSTPDVATDEAFFTEEGLPTVAALVADGHPESDAREIAEAIRLAEGARVLHADVSDSEDVDHFGLVLDGSPREIVIHDAVDAGARVLVGDDDHLHDDYAQAFSDVSVALAAAMPLVTLPEQASVSVSPAAVEVAARAMAADHRSEVFHPKHRYSAKARYERHLYREYSRAALLGAVPHLFPGQGWVKTPRTLIEVSLAINEANRHRDPEAVTWGRITRVAEEAGKVIAAYAGATGQNPRKGTSHSLVDVEDELLDVAIAALGAVEHLTGHTGQSMQMLLDKIEDVGERSGTFQTATNEPAGTP